MNFWRAFAHGFIVLVWGFGARGTLLIPFALNLLN
jgi:hypothetical protein